jgi:hypothetical protein
MSSRSSEELSIGLVDLITPEGQLDTSLRQFSGELLANSGFTNFAARRRRAALLQKGFWISWNSHKDLRVDAG